MRTRYPVTFPFVISTSWSAIQALVTFLSVLLARLMPLSIASSKLRSDLADFRDGHGLLLAMMLLRPPVRIIAPRAELAGSL
jgi:hypothetical protein